MPQNSDNVRVAANGKIMVAAVGTTAPADVTTAWAAGWTDLGLASGDGVTFRVNKDLEAIDAWQSFFPVRQIVTGMDVSAEFVLRQWDYATVSLAFGGATIAETSVGSGVYEITPPAPETVVNRALGIEWNDQKPDGTAVVYRLIIPKVTPTEGLETQLVRTGSADLGVTLGVLAPPAGESAFTILSNDAALAAA